MNFTKPVFIILALVLLICGGCSRVTFGYNHADWILRYWINGYTSFNAQQKEEIHRDIDDYMRWHRQYALPEYTAFLQALGTRVDQDGALNAGEVMHLRSEISRLYRLTITPLNRPAAHVLSTLGSRQIEELRKTLAEQNREQREEALSGSTQENLAKRAERYVHFVEELVGHLSDEQENKIREMSLHIPFITTSYIEQREAKQAGLISLLKSHANEDKIAALFSQWVNTPDAPTSPQEQQAIDTYDNAMNEMITRIFELLTADQKDHLRKKISGYIDDFQKLHSATEAAGAALGSRGLEYPVLPFDFSTIEVETLRAFDLPNDGSAENELECFIQSLIPGHEVKRHDHGKIRFGTARERLVGIEDVVVWHLAPHVLVGMCKSSLELAGSNCLI